MIPTQVLVIQMYNLSLGYTASSVDYKSMSLLLELRYFDTDRCFTGF